MTSDELISNALLLYGLDDMLDLGWMVQTVHRLTGIQRDSLEIVDPTLKAIQDLVEADYAIVGNAVRDEKGFTSVESWNLPSDEAVSRIREKWSKVEGPLEIGEIVWLELTDKGLREAKRLDEEGCDPWEDVRREDS
jgi:hypothetical protein